MRSLRKISILLLALILAMSMITGCSSKKTDTATTGKDIANNTDDSMSLSGRVTAVDGKKITIAVMPGNRMFGGRRGGSGRKNRRNAPEGDPGNEGQQPPQGDDGMLPPQGDDGMLPPQGDDGMLPPQGDDGMLPPQGDDGMLPPQDNGDRKAPKMQTKEITIDDESIISIQNGDTTTSGSLKDITEGCMINITYKKSKGKKVMSSITVSTWQKPGDRSKSDRSSDNKQ